MKWGRKTGSHGVGNEGETNLKWGGKKNSIVIVSENFTKSMKKLDFLFCLNLAKPDIETVINCYLRLLNCNGNFSVLLLIYAGL